MLHCWAVIGFAVAVGVAWPVTIPLVVIVVGTRHLGLLILMHDGPHGLLHPNRCINDTASLWFGGSELHAHRPYHLQHHRFVQQSADPDLVLSAPFPVLPTSPKRKIMRDLTGQTFVKQRFGALANKFRVRKPGESAVALIASEAKT